MSLSLMTKCAQNLRQSQFNTVKQKFMTVILTVVSNLLVNYKLFINNIGHIHKDKSIIDRKNIT